MDEWLHSVLRARTGASRAEMGNRPDGAASRTARRFVFASLLLLNAALVFDAASLDVALPSILDALGGDIETVQWVASARSLTFAVFLLPAGRLGDIVGYRRTSIFGGVVFVGATVVAALAPSAIVLIAARAAQGAGAAIIAPSIVGLTARLFGAGRRGRVFGVMIAVLAVAGGLAPFFGGVLTEIISWRAIFVATAVISVVGLAGLLLAPRALDPSTRQSYRPDVIGVALLGTAVLATQVGLIEGGRIGWFPWSIALLAAGVAIGVGAVVREVHQPDGLVDRELLSSRMLVASLLARAITSFGFYGMSLYIVLFLEGTLGVTPIEVGLVMLIPAVVAVVVSPLVGRVLNDRNARWFLFGGLVLCSLGILVLAVLEDTSSPGLHVMPGLLLNAVGYCMAAVPAKVSPLDDLPERLHGRASALLSMAAKLWAGFGVAVTAALFHIYSDTSAQEAIDEAGVGSSVSTDDVEECLGVDDVEECVDELGDASAEIEVLSNETVDVIAETFQATINNTFLTIGLVTLLSSVGVYWMTRPSTPAVKQDR
ncbi:MAG: MFS transporter [Actinomycetota bacterium]